ncbi:MAG TPA: transketolase [Acidimicrobiales bacterium]|nr:transketolase [Acidimicrobiales bacterium]
MTDSLYPGASELEGRAIRQVVTLAMDAPAKAKSGHSGTAMALAPLGVMLWNRIMRHDPTDPDWSDRDRFILSCGHACILQYSLAHVFGYDLTIEDIEQFRQAHSKTPGHPEKGHAPTVEVTTGPLGQGTADGVGMALAERILRHDYGEDLVNHRTWVFASDGCIEEGISHEAMSLAGSLGLDRLTIFYDDNHITIDGNTELALNDDPGERFRAYGWHVVDVGDRANELDVLEEAVRSAIAETTRPTAIIVRSHIGFPSVEMMDRKEAHGTPFPPEAISAVKQLLGVPDEPFAVDNELPRDVLASLGKNRDERVGWESRITASGATGVKLLEQLDTNGVATITTKAELFEAGSMVATRKGMQRAMDAYWPQTPGLTAGSADLTENTGVLLKGADVQNRDNPGGRQIHYGIREHAMSASLVGEYHHGGLRPIGSTFFVFNDYARPAVRLAAISNAGVLFVYTHDSVGVGEDGPTHEPVEQLMALRAMPHLHVVRPSDANETVDLVEQYLTTKQPAPTTLILSRQDVQTFDPDAAAASAKGARKGGYVVRENDEAVFSLVATGAEVAVCLRASEQLADKGIATRVVALPCWRCFDEQPADYRKDVLRRSIPSVSLEAGATLGWANYVDDSIGINTFGMSAPSKVVLEEYNMIPAAVVAHVEHVLSEKK